MTFKNSKRWVATATCLLVLFVTGITQANAALATLGLNGSDKFSTDYISCHPVKLPNLPPFWLCEPPMG